MKTKYFLFTILISTLILVCCKKNSIPDSDNKKVETFGELTAEIRSDKAFFTHKTSFEMSQMIGREGDFV